MPERWYFYCHQHRQLERSLLSSCLFLFENSLAVVQVATSSALRDRSKKIASSSTSDFTSELQEKWAVSKPTRTYFAAVVTDINATQLLGEASVLERGPNVPIMNMSYFKPNMDAFLVELKSKD